MPMVIERPCLRPRAIWFGAKFICAMAASTAARLASATLAVPFRMRETVAGETPARRATSVRVEVGVGVGMSLKSCPGPAVIDDRRRLPYPAACHGQARAAPAARNATRARGPDWRAAVRRRAAAPSG